MVERIPGTRVAAVAHSGDSTLEALMRTRPDVLVLDIQMPGGNGFQVLDALTGADHRPVVLVLSNTVAPSVRRRALDAGAEGFYDKSREVAALLDDIRRRTPLAEVQTAP